MRARRSECVTPSSRHAPPRTRASKSASLTMTDPTTLSSFYSSRLIETRPLLAQGCGVREMHARALLRGFLLLRDRRRRQRRVAHVRDQCVYCGDGGRHNDGACLTLRTEVAGNSADEARPPQLRSIMLVGSSTRTCRKKTGATGICIIRARAMIHGPARPFDAFA